MRRWNRWMRVLSSMLMWALVWLMAMSAWAAGPVRVGVWQINDTGLLGGILGQNRDYPDPIEIRNAYRGVFGQPNVTVTDYGDRNGWPTAAQLNTHNVFYITKFNSGTFSNSFTTANIDALRDYIAQGGHLVFVGEGEGANGRAIRRLVNAMGVPLVGSGAGQSGPNPRVVTQDAMGLGPASGAPLSTTGSVENYSGVPACHEVYRGINYIFPGAGPRQGSLFISGEVQDFSEVRPSRPLIDRLAALHDAYIYGSAADLFARDTTGLINPAHPNYPCSPDFELPTRCGDGSIQSGEVCDDGNTTSGDGCNNFCQVEPGFSCPTEGGVCLSVSITSPTDSQLVNMEPPYTGTATTGASVTLTWTTTQGVVAATATVTATGVGVWSAPAQGLADGTYTLAASVTSSGGTITHQITFSIDSAPPVVTILSPLDGSSTGDNTPAIRGNTEPGASVQVQVKNSLGMTLFDTVLMANANGSFEASPTTPLPDGAFTVEITATDPAGNTGSATADFTVDTSGPAVSITSPTNGSSTSDAMVTITGTGDPGVMVNVSVRDISNMIVATAQATPNAQGMWSVMATLPAEGTYTATASSTDGGGNTATDSVTFILDTTAPAVVLTAPADGAILNSSAGTVRGNAEPGAVITLEITDSAGDVVWSDVVMANAAGIFARPYNGLMDGAYTASAVATDAAGNEGMAMASFTIDTTAPALVVTSPTSGAQVSDATPEITGTTEPGAAVTIVIRDGSGATLETLNVTAENDGSFSATPAAPLPEGDLSLEVSATDGAGNTSTVTIDFGVDLSDPIVTLISPVNNSTTSDARPIVRGTTEPGASVEISINAANGTTAYTVTVTADATGSFSAQPPLALMNGAYTASAVATDAAGNEGMAMASFTIDTTAPALVVTSPTSGAQVSDATPEITGTTEPGAAVTIVIRDGSGATLETLNVTAENDGSFSATPAAPLPEGDLSLEVSATINEKTATVTVDFAIDLTAPQVTITQPTDGATLTTRTVSIQGTTEPRATLVIELLDDADMVVQTISATADTNGDFALAAQGVSDGDYTVRVTARDAAGNEGDDTVDFTVDSDAPELVVTSPAAGAAINDASPEVEGTTSPGATVAITVTDANGDAVFTGPATVAPDGSFSLEITPDLADGAYTLSVVATGANDTRTTVSRPFTVDTTPPTVTVNINDGDTVNTTTPTITGTTEPGATVVITVGGQTIGTVTADEDGDFSFTVPGDAPLPEGDITIEVIATDTAGNMGTSGPIEVTVDPSAPTLTITSPTQGQTVATARPTIRGTTEPGLSVEVFIDGASVGSATADASGAWSLALSADLDAGSHTVKASTEVNGQTYETGTITFTVDLEAALRITSPTAGQTITTSRPTITGVAPANTVVTVRVDGVAVGTATANDQGEWELEVPSALMAGQHTVEATATLNGQPTSSGVITFTVAPDGTNDNPLTIDSPTQGQTLGGPSINVSGRGTPGATVQVSVNDGAPVEVTVGADGQWSVRVIVPQGAVTITATSGVETATVSVTISGVGPQPSVGYLVGGGCAQAPGAPSAPPVLLMLLGAAGLALLRRRR